MLLILLTVIVHFLATADYTFGCNCELETDIEKNCFKQYTENYNYHQYFPVEKSTKKDNILASVTFYVKADHDAHVLLSSTNDNHTVKGSVYEIVLGGANNTAAEIRKGPKAKGERAVMIKNAVSHNDWKGYWIRINDGGSILVGKKEDDLPFLHWRDPQPIPIKYYSFSSWDNTVALWAHQCFRNDTRNNKPTNDTDSSQLLSRGLFDSTIEDEKICENYTTQVSSYTQFFPLEKSNKAENLLANLTFYVKAESNAHIVLSSTIQPSENEPVYEVVLGAANNTMSEIRRMQKAKSKVTVKMTDAVSSSEWKAYWIRISADGLVQVGREKEDKPFIYWKDSQPLQVKYYSFSTWEDVTTSWKHQCSPSNSSNEFDRTIERIFGDDDQQCKTLHTDSILYHQFFPIEKQNKTSDILASVTFHVKAASDAHIFLSTKPNPPINEPGYEIVLGSASNTASEIRRGQKSENKTRIATNNIVSRDEWRSFWIRVKSSGLIMIGTEGEDWPILYWQDPKPLPIKYYSFASWHGVDVLWEHQCPTTNSQPIERIQREIEIPENCQNTFTFSYNYTEFFPIDKINLDGDNFVLLTFFIKANSNAHVLLSQTTKVTGTEPVYEIVLGSANNVASEIRKGQKTENREMKYMANAVSHDEWKGYWVRVEADGLIMVGSEGEDFPFMYWKDPQPFKIEYYSFSSWFDTTAIWKHRCVVQSDEKSDKNVTKPCKTFYTQGYNYFPLYPAEKPVRKNISFELIFEVKTDNLASVLLSTTPKPTEKELVYEVILGPWNGTLSEIRRGQKADARTMAVIVMTDLPPPNEWKKYWIQILNDGTILIGKVGDELKLPFMRWKDPKPLQIKYFGFSGSMNSIALWQHQCSKQNDQPTVDSRSNVRLQPSKGTRKGRN